MKIAPIVTEYAGIPFRSRTEARWAVFYDTIKVPWEYEKEAFDLPTGRYLPDFWMPQQQCWIEIKGVEPNERENALANQLAEATQKPVFVFFEMPTEPVPMQSHTDSAHAFFPNYWDNLFRWCQCPDCGVFGIIFEGRIGRLCGCGFGDRDDSHYSSPAIAAGYSYARRRNFWDR